MINLFWYKMPNGEKNFGDELGPYIVEKLSGKKVNYTPIIRSGYKVLPIYLKGFLKGLYNISILKDVLRCIFIKNAFVTIGSVISVYKRKNVTVWGAGLLSQDEMIHPANFLAVRGKYTQKKIKDLGYKEPTVLGDPAVLMPLFIKGSVKKYKLGIIPHYIHFDEVSKSIKDENILVINLLDDIEKVIANITSCEKTLSTSLHGVIISHAYKIPSIWIETKTNKLAGDNIKFKDYFSSVEMKEYLPVIIDFKKDNLDINILLHNFDLNLPILPNKSIESVQKELLSVFPYKHKI